MIKVRIANETLNICRNCLLSDTRTVQYCLFEITEMVIINSVLCVSLCIPTKNEIMIILVEILSLKSYIRVRFHHYKTSWNCRSIECIKLLQLMSRFSMRYTQSGILIFHQIYTEGSTEMMQINLIPF